jgi:hypothetical protein
MDYAVTSRFRKLDISHAGFRIRNDESSFRHR